jgi:hypothetical protein
MPYDERLESLPGHAGTRVDFPQRAMLHFVSELDGHCLDLEAGRHAVVTALDGLAAREIPARVRMDDAQIATMLRRHWTEHGGSSTKLLRFLRREAQIACEQGRFRDIWRGIKVEMNAKAVTR